MVKPDEHLQEQKDSARQVEARPLIAARCCADELQALDMEQNPPWERQRWTASYFAEVVRIIEKHMRGQT